LVNINEKHLKEDLKAKGYEHFLEVFVIKEILGFLKIKMFLHRTNLI
jgi:hypothetical protein